MVTWRLTRLCTTKVGWRRWRISAPAPFLAFFARTAFSEHCPSALSLSSPTSCNSLTSYLLRDLKIHAGYGLAPPRTFLELLQTSQNHTETAPKNFGNLPRPLWKRLRTSWSLPGTPNRRPGGSWTTIFQEFGGQHGSMLAPSMMTN